MSIRLVLISVASLDGMLKFIAGLSCSVKFAGHTHFINNYLGGKIERECESKMSCPCKNSQHNDSARASNQTTCTTINLSC